ncbi:MAG: EFR1 family ferrodoxin [Synergistaceae bacterium]
MQNLNIEFYVFSGTGNTKLIADKIGERFVERGHSVNFHKIEESTVCSLRDNSVLGIAFPVAFFTSYPLVLKFLSNLPKGNGRRVFLIGTMAGSGMGLEPYFKKLLKKKGYDPIGAELFLMPSNYNNNPTPVELNKNRVANALARASAFADELMDGSAKWKRGFPIITGIWSSLMRSKLCTKLFYFLLPIKVDNSKCIKCMRCFENCPTRAIYIKDEFPVINNKLCESCQRCVAFCPTHAIYVEGKVSEQYRAMEFEDFNS